MVDSNIRHPAISVWIWFVVVFIALGLFVGLLLPGPGTGGAAGAISIGFAFGFLFASVSLVSIWSALESFASRTVAGIVCNIGILFAFSGFVLRTGGPWEVVFAGLVAIVVLNLVVQFPLWVLRSQSGYRLVDKQQELDSRKPQFSIGNMMALTTLFAIFFAAAKLLPDSSQSDLTPGSRAFEWLMLFGVFGLAAAANTLGALWVWSTKSLPVLAATVVIWMGLTAVAYIQIRNFAPNFWESSTFAITTTLTVAASVVALLWFLDLSGRQIGVSIVEVSNDSQGD